MPAEHGDRPVGVQQGRAHDCCPYCSVRGRTTPGLLGDALATEVPQRLTQDGEKPPQVPFSLFFDSVNIP